MQERADVLPPDLPETDSVPEEGTVLRLWRRIPSPIRAILSGILVFSVIQNGWFTLFIANLQLAPRVPWSVPLGLLWLWLILSLRLFLCLFADAEADAVPDLNPRPSAAHSNPPFDVDIGR